MLLLSTLLALNSFASYQSTFTFACIVMLQLHANVPGLCGISDGVEDRNAHTITCNSCVNSNHYSVPSNVIILSMSTIVRCARSTIALAWGFFAVVGQSCMLRECNIS